MKMLFYQKSDIDIHEELGSESCPVPSPRSKIEFECLSHISTLRYLRDEPIIIPLNTPLRSCLSVFSIFVEAALLTGSHSSLAYIVIKELKITIMQRNITKENSA